MSRRFHFLLFAALFLSLALPLGWMAVTAAEPPAAQGLSRAGEALIAASLNLAMSTDTASIARELSAHDSLRQADLLFVQEVVRERPQAESVAEQLARLLGKEVAFSSPDEGRTQGGLAILASVPLRDVRTIRLQPQNLIFRSRKRIALAATAATRFGPVRVINTHLDTRINPAQRLSQLEPALEDAAQFRGPSVIGGDFNTNDMQWVSNVVPVPFPGWQASRLRALMASRGFTTPFQRRRATFDYLGMQLDWIYLNGLRAQASGVEPVAFSDHHAVWAQIKP